MVMKKASTKKKAERSSPESDALAPLGRDVRQLIVRGARENNLKGIDLELPIDRLIAFAGPSGSGKSSLVFDTIYAEGQRRYLEALSLHLQGMADAFSRPKVDLIEGIPPMIAVRAMAASPSSRATIGSVSEILPYLRLLLVKIGRMRCGDGSFAREGRTPASIAEELLESRGEGERFMVLAPLYGLEDERLKQLIRQGWTRFFTARGVLEAGELLPADFVRAELLIDRLAIRERSLRRIREAIEQAYELSGGLVTIFFPEGEERLFFQETAGCPPAPSPEGSDDAGQKSEVLPALTYDLLDPHRPEGRCEACMGQGVVFTDARGVEGKRRENESAVEDCPDCRGTRLSSMARRAHLGPHGFEALLSMDLGSLRRTLRSLELSEKERMIAAEPLGLIDEKLEAIEAIGLSYLSAKRPLSTLSGGEVSRLRLAQQLGARLRGILYALEEPSAGLHPADLDVLIRFLRALVQRENGVLLVEHSIPLLRAADLLVELGPSGGEFGGEVVAFGEPTTLFEEGKSPTSAAIHRLEKMGEARQSERRGKATASIEIRGARAHNLQNLDVSIPKARLVCVTGRSGSGKSSLVFSELLRAAKAQIGGRGRRAAGEDGRAAPAETTVVRGLEGFERVIVVDASPIGRSARAIPLTTLQIFDNIREIYAALPDARARGWRASRFSFNVKGGRCERCEGLGVISVDMRFLPDLEIECEECLGSRFKDEMEEVRFKGYSIARLLTLSVSEAIALFEAFPKIDARLKALERLGLGYLRLGQRANTLSSGEAQRLRLARELSGRTRGRALYLLDEPSRGLHLGEVDLLIRALDELVERGHSVIAIEHHLAIMAAADHLIDLGPGAGPEGGRLVAEGSPEALIARREGATAEALRAFMRAGG